MKRKLACADFTFPLLEHQQVLDLIAMLGFDGVDIGLFEGRSHLHPSAQFDHLRQNAKRLRDQLAQRRLACADVFLQMDNDFARFAVNHPGRSRRKKARDWFLKLLDYVSAVGAGHVTVLPGMYFDDEPKRDSWGRCCDELAWRVERSQSSGLILGVEGHVGSIAPRPKALARLVRDVPGLTLTLDYTHFTRIGLPDVEVEPLIEHASHFHVRGARRGRLQTSFDKNTIDYRRIVEVMQRTDYIGWVGIEYIWIDWEHGNENDCLSETIRFRDLLRSLC